MKTIIRLLALLPFIFFICFEASAQHFVGVPVSGAIYPGPLTPIAGITLEKKFTTRSAVETGIFYRRDRTAQIVSYTDGTGWHSEGIIVVTHSISVPLLYKYHANKINFSGGPVLDIFMGWRQKDDSPVQIISFKRDRIKVGFLGKVSKFFPLRERLVLEPDLRFSSVHSVDEAALGAGITLRYSL